MYTRTQKSSKRLNSTCNTGKNIFLALRAGANNQLYYYVVRVVNKSCNTIILYLHQSQAPYRHQDKRMRQTHDTVCVRQNCKLKNKVHIVSYCTVSTNSVLANLPLILLEYLSL